jgi:hypothetical protein
MLGLFAEALETDLLLGAEAFHRSDFRELVDLVISSSLMTRKSWVLAHATSEVWTVLNQRAAGHCLAIRLAPTQFALVLDAARLSSVGEFLPPGHEVVPLDRFSGFTLQALWRLFTDKGNAA